MPQKRGSTLMALWLAVCIIGAIVYVLVLSLVERCTTEPPSPQQKSA